ncbi:helix-turn-helix transcriptional regulator [Nocardia sp. NPDC006044]|uniref:helix-turn-helix transcriptional regulator n=1 Tax=Nocardia sp. NPDC006044 TaxID=3364306 RepID=UPI0036B77865
MAVVLDTATVAPHERADLVAAVIRQTAAPMHLELAGPDRDIRCRFEQWQFGDSTLLRSAICGIQVVRTPRLIRQAPATQLLINFTRGGTGARFARGATRQHYDDGDLFLLDLNRPFEAEYAGGECVSLQVPHELLGISEDTIRGAADRLRASPLHRLLVAQLAELVDIADGVREPAASSALGESCVEITRALLVTAVDHGDGTAVPADIMVARIRAYIRRHLTDPTLSPATIARAHYISIRHLYKICARAGIRLEQWIIAQRLDQARTQLAHPDLARHTIAAVAHRYGFRDPAHFTQRFRATYGMTPSQWRAHTGHRQR